MSNAEQQQNASGEEAERELSEDELEAVRGGGSKIAPESSAQSGPSLPGVGGQDPNYTPPSYLPTPEVELASLEPLSSSE
ncbi:hypothetical protein [Candidatus Poriferisodalis multihospitum]|uniref:hypothetical protein n=1 Tax=Candidatus Poriferisodalis multihospitum TaxID=2983191 RepID=UPI002B25D9BB|nr:hypothetical protein [Candidatus Poriferisodalis multihospitum]